MPAQHLRQKTPAQTCWPAPLAPEAFGVQSHHEPLEDLGNRRRCTDPGWQT